MNDLPPTPDPYVSADLSGKRLGDFQILRRLGRGAMAEVYLAEQGSLQRQVALKVLRPELARDATYLQRFRHEAMAAASLTHANIVQIHDVGQIDGVNFIAQEYVAGRNLGELVRRQGPLSVKLAVTVLRQVAAALHKASQHNIVHRDIKPENIMLARTGEVKVADFGLARVQGGDGLALTQVGVTMGTPLYMAPEQIEGRALDCRADLYALGVTSFHMLAGRPPFVGETPLSVAVQHLNSPIPSLEDIRPDMPSGLCRIVYRLMAKKPADRYATPRDLMQELRGLKIAGLEDAAAEELSDWSTAEMIALTGAQNDATQHLAAVMQTAGQLIPEPMPRGRWIALVAACLAIGGGAAVLLRPDSPLAGVTVRQVPRRDTAWAQLYHAKMVDTEAAWQSVGEYYPDNSAAVNLAREGLARYYIGQTGEYEKALAVVDELAARGDTEASFRAFGLAGRCVVLSLLGRQEEALAAIDQVTPDMIDQLDGPMRRTLEDVMQRNRSALRRGAQATLERLHSENERLP